MKHCKSNFFFFEQNWSTMSLLGSVYCPLCHKFSRKGQTTQQMLQKGTDE
uniref:Uncharacterized protein n=1 Tax=Arundo donax TaxID=35708 RepID=A0A0A9CKS5_ARUDO